MPCRVDGQTIGSEHDVDSIECDRRRVGAWHAGREGKFQTGSSGSEVDCLPIGNLVCANRARLANHAFELLGEHADDDDSQTKVCDAGGTGEEDEDDGGRDEDGLSLELHKA